MSASGLPGSRVAAMRAGMRMRTSSAIGLSCRRQPAGPERMSQVQRLLIRVARGEANRVSVRRRGPWRRVCPAPLAPLSGADSRWIPSNSTKSSAPSSAPAWSCWRSTSPPARCSRRSKPAKPGYEIAVQEARPPAKPARAGAGRGADRRCVLASADVETRRDRGQEMRACHTFDKGGPNRVGPNLWGIVGRPKASEAGLQLFGGDEGQGRQLDARRARHVPGQSAGYGARHEHDLRRHAARQASAPT